jgi:predicted secreted protein
MTGSTGITGVGATFLWGSTAVVQIYDHNGPKNKATLIEISNFDSLDGWKEWIAGLKEGGTTTLAMVYLKGDAGQKALRDALGGAASAWTLTLSDGTVATGTGLVEGWDMPVKVNDKVIQNVSIRNTGPVTVT